MLLFFIAGCTSLFSVVSKGPAKDEWSGEDARRGGIRRALGRMASNGIGSCKRRRDLPTVPNNYKLESRLNSLRARGGALRPKMMRITMNSYGQHFSCTLLQGALTIIFDHFQQGNHKHLMSSSSWRVCYDDNVPWSSELNAGFYMSMHFFSFHHTAICLPRNLAGRCYCHLHTLKLPHIIQPSDHSYKTVQIHQAWFCDAPSKPARFNEGHKQGTCIYTIGTLWGGSTWICTKQEQEQEQKIRLLWWFCCNGSLCVLCMKRDHHDHNPERFILGFLGTFSCCAMCVHVFSCLLHCPHCECNVQQ